MASERRRRRAAATTAVGGTLVATGGTLRSQGIKQAEMHGGRIHGLPVTALRHGPAGRARYAAGTAAGLVGTAGFASGLHELTRKRDETEHEGFVREGIRGNADAVRDKIENARTPAPARVRGTALGIAAGAGAAGSLAAHRVLDRVARGTRLRPAITALSGAASGVAALPIANRAVNRHGYEVTPNGVKRRKKAPVRPTRSATQVEARPDRSATHNARGQIVPSDRRVGKRDPMDYPGARLSPNQKRARVIAAGAAPVVGPAAAALTAARLAPPDQRGSAAALQYGGFAGGGLVGAAAGSQLASRAAGRNHRTAERFDRAERGLSQARRAAAARVPGRVGAHLQRRVGPDRPPGRVSRAVSRAAQDSGALGRLARPVARHRSAAVLGALGGKAGGAAAGAGLTYSYALHREQRRREALSKADNDVMMTRREQVAQYKRKRRNIGLGALTTANGAAGTALFVGSLRTRHPTLKPKLERAALGTSIAGGTLGAVSGASNLRVARRDLRAEGQRLRMEPAAKGLRASGIAMRRTRKPGVLVAVRRAQSVTKIDTDMHSDQAKQIVGQYGLRGPLPRQLDRDTRMKAYEARYVAAGGPKGEKWQHRADDLDHVTGAALATGGTAAAGELAARTQRGQRLVQRARINPARLTHRANRVGLGAAAVGTISELAHRHAQHRASSYSSSPAGVAASALRRMRDYTGD